MANIMQQVQMSAGWRKLVNENPVLKGKLGLQFGNRPLEIFPGLTTTDPKILRTHERWYKTLSENWVAKSSAQDQLLPLNWDALLARGGYTMSPVSIGMEDNEYLVKELPSGFIRAVDKVILDELAKVMFGKFVRASMSIKKSSSAGFPHFRKDIDSKIEMWKHGMDVCRAFKGKRLTPYQWLSYKVPCIYYCGRRTQPEGLKPRQVFDGFNFVESSKDIGIPGFHAMRFRLVYGGSGSANYVINTAFTPIRKYYYSAFEKTYKVRYPEDLVDRMSRFGSHMTIDVKNYDTTIQEWHFRELLRALSEQELLDPVLLSLLEACLGGPSASGSPYPLSEGKPWRLIGDPLDNDTYTMRKGLMSGIATVSDFGRFFMTWTILCELHQVTGDVVGNIDRYLRHMMPLAAFCNSSDDNYIGTASKKVMDDLMAGLRKTYFKIEPEDQLVYLGTQYFFRGNGRLDYAPVIQSAFVKWNCPEYAISNMIKNTHRVNFGDGFMMRDRLFDKHENYRDIYEELDSIFERETGSTMLGSIRSVAPRSSADGVLTTADSIYLDNPDAIHYKINIEDVSPHLIAMDSNVISEPEVTACLTTLLGPKAEEYQP